jgi:nitrate/TMAO reductase-like tetraheme cytochrome c subunit
MGMKDLIGEYSHGRNKPEAMEERRPTMAEKVCLRMLINDSKNCRAWQVWETVKP